MPHTAHDFFSALYARLPQDNSLKFEVRLLMDGKRPDTKFYSLRQLLYLHTSKPGVLVNAKNEEGFNIYFGINPRTGKRGRKEDIAGCVALYADIDVKDWLEGDNKNHEDIAVILKKKPDVLADIQLASKNWTRPPSAVIDSGRGYQLYWFLKEPVMFYDECDRENLIAMIEAKNHAIEQYYQGDHIGNIDRIFRIPGYKNRKPVRKEQNEKGKWVGVDELCSLDTSVIFMDLTRLYDLEKFPDPDTSEGQKDLINSKTPITQQEPYTVQTPTPVPEAPATTISPIDQAIIEKAMKAKNGKKFTRLWRGNYNQYKSQSEAEYALVLLLAYWCDNDRTQIDRIFRQSGLYREKWNQEFNGTTNGWHTIDKVLAQRQKDQQKNPPQTERDDAPRPMVETLDDFLKLLKNVLPGKHDLEWKGSCPCHPYDNTFLTVSEVNNILRLECGAGCHKDQILAALKLDGHSLRVNPDCKKGEGYYEVKKWKKDKSTGETYPKYEEVSNFTFRVVNNFYDEASEVIQREIQFHDNAKTFLIPPESMLSVQKFREFCIGQGYYMFTGQANDLNKVWERELDDGPQRQIMEPDHVGVLQHEPGWWMFGNCCLKEGVKGPDCLLKPDEKRNIFWIDGRGYKPRSLTGTDNSLPHLFGEWPKEGLTTTMADLIDPFHDSMDGYKGNLLLGWVAMVLMMREITERFHRFPILYFAGRSQSGKTTTIRWLYSFFGVQDVDGASFGKSSPVALMRDMAYWSSMPVWYDEYLNSDNDCKKKDGLLKNIYDRQGTKKGVKKSFGQEFYKVRGCLILSGEENPDVNSILTRCITLPLTWQKSKRQTDAAEMLKDLLEYFPMATVEMLQKKTKPNIDRFFTLQTKYELQLKDIGDRRLAFNYSLVLAAYDVFIEPDKKFQDWLFEYAKTDKHEKSQETPTNAFLADFYTMVERDLLKNTEDFLLEGTSLYLPFDSVYDVWIEYLTRKHQRPEHKKSTLRDYFKEEPFFVLNESVDEKHPTRFKLKRIAPDKPRRSMCLDTTQHELLTGLPELLRKEKVFTR